MIHCLGPIYGVDEPSDQLLAACYRHALSLAQEHGIGSVAFPAISTGAFGYPLEAATEVALTTITRMLAQLSGVRHIRFVLHDATSLHLYERMLESMPG